MFRLVLAAIFLLTSALSPALIGAAVISETSSSRRKFQNPKSLGNKTNKILLLARNTDQSLHLRQVHSSASDDSTKSLNELLPVQEENPRHSSFAFIQSVSRKSVEHHLRNTADASNSFGNHDDYSSRSRSGTTKSRKYSKPFAVQIGSGSFYGGLVTYSHELHPARICRVMNACVRSDGTLVLPIWMQRHDTDMSFSCGHEKLEFSLDDSSEPPPLRNLDLVGLLSPRPSMPHFLVDFIPNAVVFDLVYGGRKTATTCHSRRGSSCDAFPKLRESLNPAVFLPRRLKLLVQKKSWVRQFVNLMKPSDSGKRPKLLFTDQDVHQQPNMECYRSAFFTRGPFNKLHIMDDHLRDIHFLKSNGIHKEARNVRRSQNDELQESRSCFINITISNRRLTDKTRKRLVGRYITNIPTLRMEIMRQAKRIPSLRVKVIAITLEGKSLRWQINAMQKTDVWVAGHGPLLANMLFLRQNSSVIEIQPFAYYPLIYENIAARVANVKYERYIADPDIEAFEACIQQLYPSTHAFHGDATALLERYTRASQKFFQADNTHSLVLHTLSGFGLEHVKTCARMQRLTTNSRNIAKAIVRQARIRCNLPQPEHY